MIHDDEGRHAGRFERADDFFRGRPLIVHENRPGEGLEVERSIVADQVNPQQFHQGYILLVADLAAVEKRRLDVKACADQPVRERRRNGIGVGERLQDDGMAFTPVRLQDRG